jgi:hypothetical protein
MSQQHVWGFFMSAKFYLEHIDLVKRGSSYSIKYVSSIDGMQRRVLRNFTPPYFAGEAAMANPNTWHLEHQRFKSWLLDEATTNKDKKISVSSANKAINNLNKFSERLRDQARVLDWSNFRPLSSYPASMQNRKGADDLVDVVPIRVSSDPGMRGN